MGFSLNVNFYIELFFWRRSIIQAVLISDWHFSKWKSSRKFSTCIRGGTISNENYHSIRIVLEKKGVLSAWLILIYQINNFFFNECQEKFAISRKNDFCEYLVYTVLIKSKNLEFWYDLIFDLCMTKKKLINIQIHDRFWNSSFKVHWQGPKFDPPWK